MSEKNCYCIVYEGIYSERLSYVEKSDICELAKYINESLLRRRTDIVKEVYLTDSYDSKNKQRVFFQTEYGNQLFLESYEARLLEQHRINKLLV